jgi:3-(3-hydroxy-phenyl)propionate hydroxylase
MTRKFVSILIVGAGPTGLTAANLLGKSGIETLLIERNTGLSDSPRAITIDDEGLRICQALGLRDQVLEHVLLDIGAQFFSHGQLIMRLTPSNHRNGYPLISTFNQPRLEATLLAGLQRFSNVEVLFGHTLDTFMQTEQEVLVSVRTPTGEVQHIACAYLLACDGGKSSIRRILGIPMCGTTFPQRWLVVDGFVGTGQAQGSVPTGGYVTCFYDQARPVVSIPAPDQHWRWEFMLQPEEREDLFGQAQGSVPTSHLRRLLLQIGDEREPRIIRQAIYTFHASYAASFAQGRVFLLGDAAHLLPPFGGQGMNSGLRDAWNLAWKLALVLHSQTRPSILATYQQERMPHIIQMLRFATFLGNQLVMPTSRPRAFLRDTTLRALMRLPPVAANIREMRAKPETCYKHGLILASNHRHRHLPTGRLLPQPTVLLPGNQPVQLDELLGPGFALVRLHPDPSIAFKPLQADLWHKLEPRHICLVPTMENIQNTCKHVISALDSQQHIAHFLRGQSNHLALIRPDRHVLGTFRADKEQAFAKALQEHLFL